MKKILAMMLTAAMMLSMSAAVMADETTETETPAEVVFGDTVNLEGTTDYEDEATVNIVKNYKLANADTESPADTFTFTNLTCTGVKDVAEGVTKDNAPVPTIVSVSYAQGEATLDGLKKNIAITIPGVVTEANEATITPDATTGKYTVYPSVGEYTYTFKEVVGTTAGVTYFGEADEADDITLVVTVIEDGGKLRVASIHTEETAADEKSDTFENIYSAGTLSVKKTVTGTLGDTEKYFEVVVTFTAPEGETVKSDIYYDADTTTKKYSGVKALAVDADETGWTGSKTVTILVNNEDTITFTNIPYGVTYTVVETEANQDGYDTEYSLDGSKVDAVNSEIGETTDNTVADTVVINNDKDGDIDTGISVDSIPYIAMLGVVAVGGAGVVVSKKRRSED